MVEQTTELIQYITAEQLAAVYRESVASLRFHLEGIEQATSALRKAFDDESGYNFGVHIEHGSGQRSYRSHTADEISQRMKLAAWKAIIQKLNIRRLMSSGRAKELDEALSGGKGAEEFPDITPETIQQVAAGYCMSANEFLEEAIAEEYRYWRPGRRYANYKRNSDWKLNRKIIQTYCVEAGYGGKWRCNYHNQQHVTALDSIFHMLAGRGPVKEYKGPLASAIEETPLHEKAGETEFFKFRCNANGNLHLEFKRQDLLDLFNSIAGKRDRLGHEID
jgi:hypothetical protein